MIMGLEGGGGGEAVEGEVEDAGWLVGGDRLVADEQAVVQGGVDQLDHFVEVHVGPQLACRWAGTFPVWMKIQQAVCGIVMIGVALAVNARGVRSAFARR
jgi:hypothetical protein